MPAVSLTWSGSRNAPAPVMPDHRLHFILQVKLSFLDGDLFKPFGLVEKSFLLELLEAHLAACVGFHQMSKVLVLAMQDLLQLPEIVLHGSTSLAGVAMRDRSGCSSLFSLAYPITERPHAASSGTSWSRVREPSP